MTEQQKAFFPIVAGGLMALLSLGDWLTGSAGPRTLSSIAVGIIFVAVGIRELRRARDA